MNEAGNNIWIIEITDSFRLIYYRKLSMISIRRSDGKLFERINDVNDWTLKQLEDYISNLKASINEKSPSGATKGLHYKQFNS